MSTRKDRVIQGGSFYRPYSFGLIYKNFITEISPTLRCRTVFSYTLHYSQESHENQGYFYSSESRSVTVYRSVARLI